MTLELIRQLLGVPDTTLCLPGGPSIDREEWLEELHASKVCTNRHGCPCPFCSKARATVEALNQDFVGTVFHSVGGKG